MVPEPSGLETLVLRIYGRVNERLRVIDVLSEVDGYVNFSQRNLAMTEALTYYVFRSRLRSADIRKYAVIKIVASRIQQIVVQGIIMSRIS